jgi:uncharacterized membrane protein
MAEATLHQQIADAEKQLKDLTDKADALKKQARDADLATAKALIKMHGFTATDLSPELKRTRSATTTTKTATKGRAKKK